MTWPKKDLPTYLYTSIREHPKGAILETCERWDISEWWEDMAWHKKTIAKTILETCDIWDTDYNSDSWEPEFVTIIVTWQLRVSVDSIRNSCDVLIWTRKLRVETFWLSMRFHLVWEKRKLGRQGRKLMSPKSPAPGPHCENIQRKAIFKTIF